MCLLRNQLLLLVLCSFLFFNLANGETGNHLFFSDAINPMLSMSSLDTCDHDYQQDTWMFNYHDLLFGDIFSRGDFFYTVFNPPNEERRFVEFNQYGKVVKSKSIVDLPFRTPIPLSNGHFVGTATEFPNSRFILNWDENFDIELVRRYPDDFVDNNNPLNMVEYDNTSSMVYSRIASDTFRYFEIDQNHVDTFVVTNKVDLKDPASIALFTELSGTCDEIGTQSNGDAIFALGAREHYENDTLQTFHILKVKTNGVVERKRFYIEDGFGFPYAHCVSLTEVQL